MKRNPSSVADSRGSGFGRGAGAGMQVRFGGKFTRGTLVILGIYTFMYLLLLLPGVRQPIAAYLLLTPTQALGPRPYQLLTAPLITTEFFSLLFIGLLLWSVGSAIELRLGLRRFLGWAALCSLASSVGAAAVGRLVPSLGDTVVPLGGSALFPLVLIAFAQMYGDAQVTMWGIGQPVSGRKLSYFFVALGLGADLYSRSWLHLSGQAAAVLCALLLTQGSTGVGTALRQWWRRRRKPAGMQVIDGGRPGPRGPGGAPRREPQRWVN